MSAEERREEVAFMIDGILRTIQNLKENFNMYESATTAILNIARAGIAPQPRVTEQPAVLPEGNRNPLTQVKVDRKGWLVKQVSCL